MSYDVSIGDESFNYTWNMYQFFADHIAGEENGGGINELMDKDGTEAFIIIRAAMENIVRTYRDMGNVPMQEKYNAPNGWGSVIGAILFLSQIMGACAANPDEKVRVS